MKTRKNLASIALCALRLLFLVLVLGSTVPASAQETGSKPVVIPPLAHDVSPSLRDIVASTTAEGRVRHPIFPLRRTPPLPGASQFKEDQALQTSALPLVSTNAGLSFAGISADGVAPPDTNGSVGSTQYVQIVNVQYAV